MRNKEVADVLERMGTLLEIQGEIVFKTRSYFKAAESIANLTEDIDLIRRENRLEEIPGIGKTLAEKIAQYLDTGKIEAYEKLTGEIPESLLEVVGVPSIGPKKAKLFFETLKIKNLADLVKAAEGSRLAGLPGIQEKTIENILRGIRIVREGQERMNLGMASDVAAGFISALKEVAAVQRIASAGSLRRGRETIRDIDILVDSLRPREVMEAFVRLPQVKSIHAHGETKSSVLTQENVQVDLRVVDPGSFGAALLYFTGSKGFNITLRQIAIKKGMKVNEYGIFALKGGKEERLAGKTEEECFAALGLPYIPPELREDIGEEELSEVLGGEGARPLPALIEPGDIQGDLHVHSPWSDGHNTIAQMVEAARRKGYRYLAITDHSEHLKVAGGVSVDNLKRKKREIDALNKKLRDFRVLFGTEVEIDTQGNLDYNDEVLSRFDMVIAAIHSGFEQGAERITQRLVKACRNPCVHGIAHPTGVHIGKREPYAVDFQKVCQAAAANNVFLEINAFPVRLDLNSSNVYYARRQGVKFAINTDAHRMEHLDFMRLGVSIARRGWLRKEDVVNAGSLKELMKAIRKKK